MVRTSGLSAEIVNHLIDKPIGFEPGARTRRHPTSDLTVGRRESGTRSDEPFAHAVHEFAVLSLSARSVLSLRS
jgi:hypothetical protein